MNTHNLFHISRNMLKVTACCTLGLMAFVPTASAEPLQVAQTVPAGSVTGVVTDTSGEPVIGASVVLKGEKLGVTTDLDGRFTIKASAGQEFTISSVGYKPVTVKVVAGKTSYDVLLEDDSNLLDEVVAIGYGTQRKGDITSSVASVKSEDFTLGAIGDAAELVKGKVAGLTIAKGSGDPNAESTIRLRGVISLEGGSTPLVLIDGIEGGLGTVAPENIESIDVLKDASAAAIYGTRGANGVILITTKSGKREANTVATYSGYVSWATMAKKHKFMTGEQVRQGLTNYSDRGYDTDWLDAISRTAFTHNHDFQISGGNSKTTYMGNVSYRNAEGVILSTFNEELKMNFDISHWMLNDILKVHLNLVKGIHKNGALDAANSVYRQAIMRNPTEPIYDEAGLPYETPGITYYYNPVGLIQELKGEYKSEWSRLSGDVTLEPIKGWQTKLLVSTRRSNGHNAYFNTSNSYNCRYETHYSGNAGHSYDYGETNLLEATSNYRKTWNNVHRFDALVGYSWERNTNEGFSAYNADFGNDYFLYNNLGVGSLLTDGKASMGSYKNESTLIGFFGRVSYGYDNRYNVLLSIRREGSSKFGADHKWGNFPSVSLGWNVMNEEFWKGFNVGDWWDELKLRVGYGVTGVIPSSAYASLTKYSYGAYFYNDGEWKKGLEVASNPNPDLQWETSREINVGIDWDMFNGRFGGSIDVYNKNTRDMLWTYDVPVPPNLFTQTLANVGKMRNSGVELLVRGIPVQTRNFEWSTNMTFSHNSNKLLSLSNGLYETANEHETAWLGEPISQATHRLEVGKAVDRYFGIKSVGVSERGLWLVEDPTGAYCGEPGGVVELTDEMLPDSDMKQDLGNSLPKFYLGWNNTFRYKAFDLNMQFTGQFGFKILNEARCYYENNSVNYNRLQSVLEAPYGDRVLAGNQKQTFVSYYLENGDFLKMTNLTFGYTVPLKKNKYVTSIRAYFSAENLFTITKYKGLDPELSNWDATASGIEWRDNYPTNRSYTIGLNVNF